MAVRSFLNSITLSSGNVLAGQIDPILASDLLATPRPDGSVLYLDGTGQLSIDPDASFFYDPDGHLGPAGTAATLYVGGGANGVNANDGYAVEDGCHQRGQAGGFAGLDRRVNSGKQGRQSPAQEGFAAHSGQQRAAQRQQFGLTGQQGVVLAEALAEAVTGVEDDGLRLYACLRGHSQARR